MQSLKTFHQKNLQLVKQLQVLLRSDRQSIILQKTCTEHLVFLPSRSLKNAGSSLEPLPGHMKTRSHRRIFDPPYTIKKPLCQNFLLYHWNNAAAVNLDGFHHIFVRRAAHVHVC